MTRHSDWHSRLHTYIVSQAKRSFRPGSHDCALFAAGAVKVMTGKDPAKGYRGKYRSLRAGRALLDGVSMVEIATDLYPEVEPILAQAGDIAVVEDDNGEDAFGVVQGSMIYVLRPAGLGLVPLTTAKRVFRP